MGLIFAGAGVLTGFFYILVILLSKPKPQSKWWLIVFLTLLILALLPAALASAQLFPPLWMNASFGLLWGPVLYFYVLSLLKKQSNYKWLMLHLTPFILYFTLSTLFHVPIIPGPPDAMAPPHLQISHNAILVFSLVQFFSLLGYAAFTLFVLKKHDKNIQNHYSYKDVYLTIRWSYVIILFFASAYLFVVLVELIAGNYLHLVTKDLQVVIITAFLYVLGYLGIKQDPVYLTMLHDVSPNPKPETNNAEEQAPSAKEKYLRNKLSPQLRNEYQSKLLTYFENEKPYLQPKLCINDLSMALEIPQHFLSQIINHSLGHTFYSFVNSYRVNEVKRRILSDDKNKYTLLAIAFDSGFNSKSGFNQNFKVETGMTPMEFKNSLNR